MADQTYLSKQKAARRLDVSEKTIDRVRSSGALEWIKVGSRVRISLASLQAYEQHKQGAESRPVRPQRERLPIPALDANAAGATVRKAASRSCARSCLRSAGPNQQVGVR